MEIGQIGRSSRWTTTTFVMFLSQNIGQFCKKFFWVGSGGCTHPRPSQSKLLPTIAVQHYVYVKVRWAFRERKLPLSIT